MSFAGVLNSSSPSLCVHALDVFAHIPDFFQIDPMISALCFMNINAIEFLATLRQCSLCKYHLLMSNVIINPADYLS